MGNTTANKRVFQRVAILRLGSTRKRGTSGCCIGLATRLAGRSSVARELKALRNKQIHDNQKLEPYLDMDRAVAVNVVRMVYNSLRYR